MRVLISGGGTGGHLFPAIAVAQALSRKDPDATILFAGRREGIEAKTVASYGMRFTPIPAAPLFTEQVWRNWSLPLVLGAALWQSWRLLDRFKPDVVLGTGGYVSVPLITAAGLARVPFVLQEQNLMPGRATRVLARFAAKVATAYPESSRFLRASQAVVTGTPVRTEFWRRKENFPERPRTILVLGGSQGAHRLNQAVADAVPWLLDRPDLAIMHQTGGREIDAMEAVKAKLPPPLSGRYEPFAFANDLADRIRAADLVISRAGASTLSEVSAIGVPMILIPYPYAGGHQRMNVKAYESSGAAIVIPDEEAEGRLRGVVISVLDDPARYRKMVEAMRGLGRPYAADEVVRLLEEVARHD
jgi:UDP-N-acetylglucosamine--N-acetylmuramyl-(pentapeptide) pyrophosphoryl-undecaprenol N-acetylglucosamine transferase